MSCKCQECSNQYKVDISVSDEVWSQIKPNHKDGEAGLLCGACIFKKIESLSDYNHFNLVEGD